MKNIITRYGITEHDLKIAADELMIYRHISDPYIAEIVAYLILHGDISNA